MNLTNLAASLRSNMTTVKACFTNRGGNLSRPYTFKITLDMARQVEPGTLLAVMAQSDHNPQNVGLAVVDSVDDFPDIDLDFERDYKWVIAIVDAKVAEARQAEDAQVGKRLRRQKVESYRQQVLHSMGIDVIDPKQLFNDEPSPE